MNAMPLIMPFFFQDKQSTEVKEISKAEHPENKNKSQGQRNPTCRQN